MLQTAIFPSKQTLTVKRIFEDNGNCEQFCLNRKDILRNVEIEEVNKMLSCKDESRGYFTYQYECCGEVDWMTCLSTYRERDVVEKGFDTLKNDLQALPLNAKTESTIRGLLFVNYLSLIVRMRLINQIRKNGLLKTHIRSSIFPSFQQPH